jgi:hypothetical protein
MAVQIHNFKYKKQIMKTVEIYNLWSDFINDDRYKKYFDLDNVRDWKIKFENAKQFIDTHKLRPTYKIDKPLSKWITDHMVKYKKKENIMKNVEIYNIWDNFINNVEYIKYF